MADAKLELSDKTKRQVEYSVRYISETMKEVCLYNEDDPISELEFTEETWAYFDRLKIPKRAVIADIAARLDDYSATLLKALEKGSIGAKQWREIKKAINFDEDYEDLSTEDADTE